MTVNNNGERRRLGLLVENDEISKEVTEIFLAEMCDVEFANTGEKALEMAQEKDYDFFLMDINLGSGLSGVDVTRRLRGMGKYKDTPIVALTAFAMKGDREEFLSAGCTHYLSKPFEKDALVDLLEEIFPPQSV
jgi:CheY-like chemotaxis protein